MHEFIPGDDSSVFIFCDHASNHVPDEFGSLGLQPAELARHIAWDIGAAVVTRELCALFGCAGLLAGVSRLVIDLNRAPDQGGLIPEVSDGTVVAGNAELSAEEMERRRTLYYDPYHAALSDALDARPDTFAVSIHSFTPHPRESSPRELDIGLLAKKDEDGGDWGSAERFVAALPSGLTARINEPYSAYDLNHTVDAHIIPRGLRHLGIEVRQDHIGTDEDAQRFARRIHPAIAAAVQKDS